MRRNERLWITSASLSVVMWMALAGGGVVTTWAQAASGIIAGTIADTQGGVLPGVTLTLQSVDSGAVREVVTEGDGRYRFAGLQPGAYNLRGELAGFGTIDVKNLTVTVGLELQRSLTLGLRGVEERVTVQGGAPLVETTKFEVSTVVTAQQIASLPIEGRSAVSLVMSSSTLASRTNSKKPGAIRWLPGLDVRCSLACGCEVTTDQ
jgi:hypothetical protein